jgi:type II secretory pathway pseudopilin PulG
MNKGFTLIEVLVAAVLSIMVALGTATLLDRFTRTAKVVEKNIDITTEEIMIYNALTRDFSRAAPSFMAVNFRLPANNCNFFELRRSLVNPGVCQTTRSFSFTPQTNPNPENGFILLSTDTQRSEVEAGQFDPMRAYFDDPFASPLPNPQLLTFSSQRVITTLQNPLYGGMLRDGQLLMFYLPFRLEPSSGQDPNSGRYLTHLVRVQGSDLSSMVSAPGAFATVFNSHPMYPQQNINTLDRFLKLQPVLSGPSTFVMVRPVKFYSYLLQPQTDSTAQQPRNRLLRYERLPSGQWSPPSVIGSNIASFGVLRSRVDSPLIGISMVMQRGTSL